jgi:hypothetical protein
MKDPIVRLKKNNPKLSIENLELYKNDSSYLCFFCECGHKWISTYRNVLRSSKDNGCIKCQKRKKSKRRYTLSNDDFIKRIKGYWGNKVEVLEEYKKGEDKIKVLCNVCDNIWNPIARSLLRGHGCPKCGHDKNRLSQLKSTEKYKEELKLIHNDRILLIDAYYNSNTKVNFKCCLCDNIWLANPNMILRGRGCPKCILSKGELIISEILKEMNIKYEEQFIIKDLKTDKGGTPRFDFAIFENNILTKIIEYDGILHFEAVNKFGGLKRLEEQKEVDNFKNKYCLENNIKMIRIPYTDMSIISIEYLKKKIYN